jgi:hypothetical protein
MHSWKSWIWQVALLTGDTLWEQEREEILKQSDGDQLFTALFGSRLLFSMSQMKIQAQPHFSYKH